MCLGYTARRLRMQVSSVFSLISNGIANAVSKPVVRFAFLISGLLCASAALPAATLERLTIEDLIEKSTAIVRGRVAGSYTAMQGSLVYTHLQIDVLERWKGSERKSLDVVVPGGVSGGVRQSFPGVPRLAAGKEYVLFLWTGRSGLTHILGFTQGVFELPKEAGEDMAVRPPITETMLEPGTGQVVRDEGIRMRLHEMRQRVHSQLARGASR